MIIGAYILSGIVAYLLGGVNAGIVISKLVAKKDIRDYGSGNAGATNVLRVLGLKPAIFTLIFDFLKSIIAVAFAMLWFKLLCPDVNDLFGLYTAALFSVVGHMFPVYFRFKGGKGVITFAGSLILIHPVFVVVSLAIFIIIVLTTRYVSLGSIIGAICIPIQIAVAAVITGSFDLNVGIEIIISGFIALLIVFMHRKNIRKLINKTENKINFSKQKKITEEDRNETADVAVAEETEIVADAEISDETIMKHDFDTESKTVTENDIESSVDISINIQTVGGNTKTNKDTE